MLPLEMVETSHMTIGEVDAQGSVDQDVAKCDISLPGNLGVVGNQPR